MVTTLLAVYMWLIHDAPSELCVVLIPFTLVSKWSSSQEPIFLNRIYVTFSCARRGWNRYVVLKNHLLPFYAAWHPRRAKISNKLSHYLLIGGPGSSVDIATELQAGRFWIESRRGRDFTPFQTGPGVHPASCTVGTRFFLGVKCGRGVLLTTHVPSSAAVMEE